MAYEQVSVPLGRMKRLEARVQHMHPGVRFWLPGGHSFGPIHAPLTLSFTDWSTLAQLVKGHVGAACDGFVEDRIQLEGTMRQLMAAAVGWIPTDPTSRTPLWKRLLQSINSLFVHSRGRDARNIQFHYDLSDDFYALWLDPQRVYSCAYYRDDGMTLAQAQQAKLDLICRKLMLRPGERFLDVGAGWGGLLMWAAEHYGVDATGITLSRNQHAHVQNLIRAKGLQDRVRIELRDYRDVDITQPFDKIASVGMFEHVGRANIPAYFEQIYQLLKPGGMVMNHGITAGGVGNFGLGAGISEFIEKYIFPGGELLHVSHVAKEMALAGLEAVDFENLRPHYARTLWDWSDALEAHQKDALVVLQQDHDAVQSARVLRAYRLYLAGSAMSFEQGWLALYQILATRPCKTMKSCPMPSGQSLYPFNRTYIYENSTACRGTVVRRCSALGSEQN